MQFLEQLSIRAVGGEQTADVLAFDEGCAQGFTVLGSKPTEKIKTERAQPRMKFGRSRTADE